MADPAASDGQVLTIAAARQHLRAGSSVSDADIADLITAGEGRIESFLGRPLVGDGSWTDVASVPRIVVHCAKLAVSDFYVNREAPQLTDDQLRPIIGRFASVSIG